MLAVMTRKTRTLYARNVDAETMDWLTAMSGKTGVSIGQLVDALLGEARRRGWQAQSSQTVVEISAENHHG